MSIKWIPVSERLPERDGRYLVTEKYYSDNKRIVFEHFISEIKNLHPVK